MRLAIAVVYLVADSDDDKLLEVHLDQIEKNTPEPYVLYAAANRLPESLRHALARHPNVSIRDLPTTELRGSLENAFYLELLVKAAIADGATHVCTLHMDSFPVRPGWATELAGRLHGGCVLAGLERDPHLDRKPLTAFLLFTREFYLTYQPTFHLPEEALGTAEYLRYTRSCPHTRDSGAGYGFKIFREGLSWYRLVRTDHGPDGWGFGIFGDTVFHLGGGQWFPQENAGAPRPGRLTFGLERIWNAARLVLPRGLQSRIGQLVPWALRMEVGHSRVARRKAELVRAPEAFLRDLSLG